MKRLIAAALLIALSASCAGSLETARFERTAKSPERCSYLDSRHRLWGALTQAGTAVAGGSGLGTIPVSESTRLALGIASGASAVFGAVAAYLQTSYSETWSRECAGK